MPLVIAQCSSKKRPGARAAMDKYITRNHDAIRNFMFGTDGSNGGYAAGWDWSILSAKHGLVHPTTAIQDYDLELSADKLDFFVRAHGPAIQSEVASNDCSETILFIGSKLYLSALKAALPGRKIKHIGAGGRGCGDYFSALKEGFAIYDADA